MADLFKYGAEIECYIPNEFMTEVVKKDVTRHSVNMGHDGSISSPYGFYPVEFRTPPLNYEKFDDLFTWFSKYLRTMIKADVNGSCGYHIHVSHPDYFSPGVLGRILNTWLAIEGVIYATQPGGRLSNRYCAPLAGYRLRLGSDTVESLMSRHNSKSTILNRSSDFSRYHALNLNSLQKYGTLEVRLHTGTLNYKKITTWARFVTAIFNYAMTKYDRKVITKLSNQALDDKKIQDTFDLLGLSTPDKTHLLGRINKFIVPKLDERQKAYLDLCKQRKTYQKQAEEYAKLRQAMEDYSSKYNQKLRSYFIER